MFRLVTILLALVLYASSLEAGPFHFFNRQSVQQQQGCTGPNCRAQATIETQQASVLPILSPAKPKAVVKEKAVVKGVVPNTKVGPKVLAKPGPVRKLTMLRPGRALARLLFHKRKLG